MSALTVKKLLLVGHSLLNMAVKTNDENLYWASLLVALTLPSVCSRIEFADRKRFPECWRHDNGNKIYVPKDKTCYIKWCKKYISKNAFNLSAFGTEPAEALYQLRCGMLHAGDLRFKVQKDDGADTYCKETFILLSDSDHLTVFSNNNVLSVPAICDEIFNSVACWYFNFPSKANAVLAKYINLRDPNDIREYHKMCEKERRLNHEENVSNRLDGQRCS